MAGIEGIDEVGDFADAMREVSGEGSTDGIEKARRDALRQTAEDFQSILVEQIRATETAKGGTLDSRTSPYEPGGENESSDSNVHISNKAAWDKTLVGNDTAVIFPKPDVHTRASWLEYGTADHGPSGDKPLYFYSGGVKIVVAEEPPKRSAFYDPYTEQTAVGDEADARFNYGVPLEVEGVEPQGFFRRAVQVTDELNIFKENMGDEIDKLFEREGIPLEGEW